jgi:hypothetical protein
MKPAFSFAAAFCLTMLMICLSTGTATLLGYYFAAPWWCTSAAAGVLGCVGGKVTVAWIKWRIRKHVAAYEKLLADLLAERKKHELDPQ